MKPEYLALNTEIIDDLQVILADAFEELVREQVEQAEEYLAGIDAALKEQNALVGSKLAHSLKSSIGQIGLQGLHWMAKDLELTLKADHEAGNPPSEHAREVYHALTTAMPLALQALHDYYASRSV